MPFYSCIFFHWKAIEANRVCKDSVIEKILIPFFTDGTEMNHCFIGRKFETYIFTIFQRIFSISGAYILKTGVMTPLPLCQLT